MRTIIGKYWWLIPLGVTIIIILAVLVQLFKETNTLAGWIFNFLQDWATILSASITFMLLVAAFYAFRENRRNQALNRIRNWAEEITVILLTSDSEDRKTRHLNARWAKCVGISADSRFLGGSIKSETGVAIVIFNNFHNAIKRGEISVLHEDFLKELYNSLFDVIERCSGVEK